LGFGLLIYSELGYALAIYGNNPKFFENQGISSKYVVSVGLALGYASSALSGFLFALCNGFVDLTMNYGIILLCLTSLILGKSSYVYFFQKTRQNLVIPFLGLCIYCVLQKLLLKVGLPLKYFNAFQALCIVATLTLFKKTKQISFDHLGV
jgi:putative ABC transport system permease protein